MPRCMDIPNVAPSAQPLGDPGLHPPQLAGSVELEVPRGVGQHGEDRLGGSGDDPLTGDHVPAHDQSPGLDCMMPPSAKMVVAVM